MPLWIQLYVYRSSNCQIVGSHLKTVNGSYWLVFRARKDSAISATTALFCPFRRLFAIPSHLMINNTNIVCYIKFCRGTSFFLFTVQNEQVVCLERQEAHPSTTGPDLDEEAAAALDMDAEGEAMMSSRRRRQGWEWSVGNMRREHTHDVHAMTIHEQSMEGRIEERTPGAARRGPVLVSGGVDASLALYSVPRFKKFVSHATR